MIDFFEALFGSKKVHALLVGHTYYAIAPAKDYPSCYRLTVRNNADFLIHQQAMQQVIPAPQTAPPNTEVWKLRDGAVEFKQLVNNWFTNTAVLYRGFNGRHFGWPRLIAHGQLVSEGNADVPTFTMGNYPRTRWLPTFGEFKDGADGVALSGTDPHTSELGRTYDVPIAITVGIRTGVDLGVSIAWLNPGEIVVRGPLQAHQFYIATVLWFSGGPIMKTTWPPTMRIQDLFPTRPYQPTQQQIQQWWDNECRPWWLEHRLVLVGHLLTQPI